MKLLVIEQKIRSTSKKEHKQLQEIFKEHLDIDLEIDYIHNRNLLKSVDVYDGSIIQASVRFDPKYDWVHVRLNSTDWRKLKLKDSLWGEHQKVRGTSVTFGRWSQAGKYKRNHLFEHEFPGMREHVSGMLHEYLHGQEGMMAVTHSYLYGYDRLYTKQQEALQKPERYVKQSSMLKALEWVFKKNQAYKLAKTVQAQLTPAPKKKYKFFLETEVTGMKHGFVLLLDKARGFAGIPFSINSGFRTPEHNKKVGGVPGSSHTKGLAADIRARNGQEIYKIVDGAMKAGITRIGINWDKKFVHLDMDGSKTSPTIWKY